jgi:hypothetical protein
MMNSNSNFGVLRTGKHKVCPYDGTKAGIGCRGEPRRLSQNPKKGLNSRFGRIQDSPLQRVSGRR